MKRALCLLATSLSLSLGLLACGGEEESAPASGVDDIKQAKDPNATVKKLVDRANCAAANGGHDTTVFTVASFDASKALAEMKAADRERGCPGRTYSNSKESAAKAFTDWLESQKDPIDEQCAEDEKPKELRPKLAELARDPKNVAVFSSLHDEKQKDDPVSCFYFRFWVYRADGTLANFDFDWSD
jgi:hypothetical protein